MTPPAAREVQPNKVVSPPSSQRVYIKISPAHEQQRILSSLKELLLQHQGSLSVVLYYESSQKTLSLNDQFNVKPSPKLIQVIEDLLGKDTARVK